MGSDPLISVGSRGAIPSIVRDRHLQQAGQPSGEAALWRVVRNEELEVRDLVGARTMARVGRVMATQGEHIILRLSSYYIAGTLHALFNFPLQALLFNLLLRRKELKQEF